VLNDNPFFNHFLFLFRFMGGVGRHAQSKVHGTAQGRLVQFFNHPWPAPSVVIPDPDESACEFGIWNAGPDSGGHK
jgi:hypothetical protein